ncbi:hypothetical protein CDV52_09475 [Haematobacter missouriensis]|uniref:Acyltransferase 3 domain-containing protein n=1 Tax=Haematobacter missouriensis TaxID=366616 RepID=A0A212ARH7_9RHOB|nr:acyltransferase [Haematobacter missouriensis]OWJ84102.1 hypothetical protein CDV52_09475 [Haematobacter missouriensis]
MAVSSPVGEAQDRIVWVDSAKALLILIVVLGHFHYMYAPVPGKDVIYYFHVPAFLFITGFLLPAEVGSLPFGQVVSRWVALYLRAYAFFSVMAIGLWWVQQCVRLHGIADPLPAIWGALYGVAGSGNGLVHDDMPLWYFPFLVTSFVIGWLCLRLPAVMGWLLAAAYLAFTFLYHGPRLPWGLDIGGVGVVALLSGFWFRRHYAEILTRFAAPPLRWGLFLLAAAVLLLAAYWNGPVNLNGAEFGRNGAVFLVGMFAGITIVVLICLPLPARPWIRRISMETLVIFATHIYFIRVASAVLPRPENGFLRFLVALAASAFIVGLCLIVARLLRPLLDRFVLRRPGSEKRTATGGMPAADQMR